MSNYLVSEKGLFQLDSSSEADYLVNDRSFNILIQHKEVRVQFLKSLGKDSIIIERLGMKIKGENDHIKFVDEFSPKTLNESEIKLAVKALLEGRNHGH